MTNITVGCWVETVHGPAVCTGLCTETLYPEGFRFGIDSEDDPRIQRDAPFCLYRYKTRLFGSTKTSWVANGDFILQSEDDPEDLVRYKGAPDETSRFVLTLKGPYGDE